MTTNYGERPGMEAADVRAMAEAACAKMYPATWAYTEGAEREELVSRAIKVLEAAQAPALLAALELCARTLGDMERHAPCDSLHDTARDLRLELLPIIAAARGERGAK